MEEVVDGNVEKVEIFNKVFILEILLLGIVVILMIEIVVRVEEVVFVVDKFVIIVEFKIQKEKIFGINQLCESIGREEVMKIFEKV